MHVQPLIWYLEDGIDDSEEKPHMPDSEQLSSCLSHALLATALKIREGGLVRAGGKETPDPKPSISQRPYAQLHMAAPHQSNHSSSCSPGYCCFLASVDLCAFCPRG